MLKSRVFLLLGLCCAFSAQAGLFSDDDARKQIQLLEARVFKLEAVAEQQTKSMLDMQGQIELLNGELRKLRGQNEELAHGLMNAEKREKDFYVDLDTRLRRFESAEDTQVSSEGAEAVALPVDPNDPVAENRAYEAAYGLFKGGSHENAVRAFQEFIKKYPASVHASNAAYWQGSAQFAMKDYEGAVGTLRDLRKSTPSYSRDADVLLNIAACQQELKQSANAQKTLKLLISKHPSSEAAAKAKKLLAK
ncbi:MAG: tol-pal system protein YbgF [Gallionella sp.]|nr:tol-pal system protein YbgF [Gallionella sp.]